MSERNAASVHRTRDLVRHGSTPVEVSGIGHVVLFVRDLDRSVAFYRGILGWRQILRPDDDVRAAAFSVGRAHYELLLIEVDHDDATASASRRVGTNRFGLRLAGNEDDVRALRDCLRANRHLVTVVNDSDPVVNGCLEVLDPDGNEVELYVDVIGGQTGVRSPRSGRRRLAVTLLAGVVALAALIAVAVALRSEPGQVRTAEGMWVSDRDLAALPQSGPAWERVRAVAAEFDSSMTDYGWQESTDGTAALAAALVAARTGDEALRAEVAEAIERIASAPYVTDRNGSALGWARNVTAWVVASDLIDLKSYRPAFDERWRSFLQGMPTHPYPGDGGDDLFDLAVGRANNIGVVARTAVTAIAIYTGDVSLLNEMAELYRAWIEGSDVHHFDWAEEKDRSWQCEPDDPATYRGINPTNCVRDGNDLSGVLPEEYRRSVSYDATEFPGPNTTKYPWEALAAAVTQAELLRRAGYPDALEWGQRAPLRALERLHFLHQVAADDGWTFGRESGGGADDRWVIPLVNALYGTDFPAPDATGHGRPLSWSDWTHQSQ